MFCQTPWRRPDTTQVRGAEARGWGGLLAMEEGHPVSMCPRRADVGPLVHRMQHGRNAQVHLTPEFRTLVRLANPPGAPAELQAADTGGGRAQSSPVSPLLVEMWVFREREQGARSSVEAAAAWVLGDRPGVGRRAACPPRPALGGSEGPRFPKPGNP